MASFVAMSFSRVRFFCRILFFVTFVSFMLQDIGIGNVYCSSKRFIFIYIYIYKAILMEKIIQKNLKLGPLSERKNFILSLFRSIFRKILQKLTRSMSLGFPVLFLLHTFSKNKKQFSNIYIYIYIPAVFTLFVVYSIRKSISAA